MAENIENCYLSYNMLSNFFLVYSFSFTYRALQKKVKKNRYLTIECLDFFLNEKLIVIVQYEI